MKHEYEIGWRNFGLVYVATEIGGERFVSGSKREKCDYVFRFWGSGRVELMVKKDGNVYELIKESAAIIAALEMVRNADKVLSIVG